MFWVCKDTKKYPDEGSFSVKVSTFMKLIKEDTYTEISGEIQLRSLVDTLNSMINFYQSSLIRRDNWLTKQERLFFIACAIISNKAYKYTSVEATDIYKNIFNLRRQSDVRGLIVRLEEKKWIKSDKSNKTLSIPEFFKMDLDKQRVKIDITLNFENETNRLYME